MAMNRFPPVFAPGRTEFDPYDRTIPRVKVRALLGCALCGARTDDFEALSIHVKLCHLPWTAYNCLICGITCYTKSDLIHHVGTLGHELRCIKETHTSLYFDTREHFEACYYHEGGRETIPDSARIMGFVHADDNIQLVHNPANGHWEPFVPAGAHIFIPRYDADGFRNDVRLVNKGLTEESVARMSTHKGGQVPRSCPAGTLFTFRKGKEIPWGGGRVYTFPRLTLNPCEFSNTAAMHYQHIQSEFERCCAQPRYLKMCPNGYIDRALCERDGNGKIVKQRHRVEPDYPVHLRDLPSAPVMPKKRIMKFTEFPPGGLRKFLGSAQWKALRSADGFHVTRLTGLESIAGAAPVAPLAPAAVGGPAVPPPNVEPGVAGPSGLVAVGGEERPVTPAGDEDDDRQSSHPTTPGGSGSSDDGEDGDEGAYRCN